MIVVVDHHEPCRNAPEKHHDPQKHSRKRSVTLSCRRELGIIVRTMLDEPHRSPNTFGEYTVTITAMSLGPPVERSTVAVLVFALAVVLAGCGMPFTGGDGGTGWPFGDLPCVSDCLAVLERVEGVDHVAVVERALDAVDVPAVSPDAGGTSNAQTASVDGSAVEEGRGSHEDGAPDGA
jgi:hypothetical protein